MMRAAVAGALGAASLGAVASGVNDSVGGPKVNQLNLHEPVTKVAEEIFHLHTMMLVICLLIFCAVFGVMFYSIYAHRKSKGHKAETWHESTKAEIAWTVVPFLIVIGMALPATGTVVKMKDTSNADITIKVTGYQWKWGYDYLKGEGQGISFLSTLSTPRAQVDGRAPQGDNYLMEVDNEMVVPVGKKIRMVTTANDVIHAWMVPSFGVKQDAIPGFVRDTWFKAEKVGVYRGQCAELCGKDHAFMPIVVRVVTDQEYTAWVDKKKKEMAANADDPTKTYTQAELMARGEKVYTANCVACHQATGMGVPGAFPKLAGSAIVGNKPDQITMLLNGKGAMPKWSQLNDVELAAVATYTKNSWGNSFGLVQPADFTAARK
ncbi:cytochrome c oxidase subunit II [Piscinibacterium candidicorallinum]|uniref:Cytochrome c oxidase subunit 2 n=1 Tax=Piscinibacterium candidicorallinum TaxID=1793872 RepID=A0ABV7HBS7_9BURK